MTELEKKDRMKSIEQKIIDVLTRYEAANPVEPNLLILPFEDYIVLQLRTAQSNRDNSTAYTHFREDYSAGKFYLGMIVEYDHSATEIVIKHIKKGG